MEEMKALNALVEDMSQRLDENTKQTYQNRLVVFDNAVGMLNIDCQTAETMFAKAAKIADERGEGLPANLVGESTRLEPPADPVYPPEPTITMPEQPAHIKNARPVPSQPRAEGYAEAHRAWEAECAHIDDGHARQVAEYEAAK